MITLYYGSNVPIDKVDLCRGRKGKNFGQGFYLSDDIDQASRMAQFAAAREGRGTPVITTYDFDDEGLAGSLLKTIRFDSYSEAWAKFIVLNRSNRSSLQAHDYDFVYGPIANDRVGVQIRLFQEEYIPIDALIERLKFVKPTFQYFFATERSLKYLVRKEVKV
jgi:hypothetical protein